MLLGYLLTMYALKLRVQIFRIHFDRSFELSSTLTLTNYPRTFLKICILETICRLRIRDPVSRQIWIIAFTNPIKMISAGAYKYRLRNIFWIRINPMWIILRFTASPCDSFGTRKRATFRRVARRARHVFEHRLYPEAGTACTQMSGHSSWLVY